MKIHQTHSFTKKLLHWIYCSKCGLVNLKNDATRKAMNEKCSGHDA